MSHGYEHIENIINNENSKWLQRKAEDILNTSPCGSEIEDLKFLFKNKRKIIGNKRLIELLGCE